MLLRVSPGGEAPGTSRVLNIDQRKKTVTLFDPGSGSTNSQQNSNNEENRVGIAAPKMFAFDGIYTSEDSQVRLF